MPPIPVAAIRWAIRPYRAKSGAGSPVRREGKPEDFASAAAWLRRDDADYVTGQVIGMNGACVIGPIDRHKRRSGQSGRSPARP